MARHDGEAGSDVIETDFVVVGAGSAGCVVAARLAEAGHSVCLLEAGKRDTHPWIHIPAGVGKLLYSPAANWMYSAEPEAATNGRRLHVPLGKVLGGGSSINGMLYVRGNPADYDGWAQAGCRGWSYDDVLPLFRRSEDYSGRGDPAYRSRGGPLKVQDYRTILPLTHLFVKAAQEAHFPFTDDYNAGRQEGVAYAQMTRRGRTPGSTYRSFLRRPEARRNVAIATEAHATELTFEDGRCTGVRYRQGGASKLAVARREVIVSGGAIHSPKLLQLSGIGDPEHLRGAGIEPRIGLPGVGRNLSDHLAVRVVCWLRDLTTINELSRGWRFLGEAARFALLGNGALTFGVTSAMVFCRSREGLASPDLQLAFTPASYVFGKALALEAKPGMTVAVVPTRPGSRGTVLIDGPDPLAPPKIRYGFLSDPDDLRVMIAGLAQARRIFAAAAFAPYLLEETRPGRSVTGEAELTDFVRRESATLYHPAGTCKMGLDEGAVVDPRLQVRGIRGLRVADASIMPCLTTGNTNAPTIMIGEKAAAMILEDIEAQS